MAYNEVSKEVIAEEHIVDEYEERFAKGDRTISLIYANFILWGAGFLMPWNSIINALDYFQYLYPTKHSSFDFAVAYMIPNVLGFLIAVKYGHKFSFASRIVPGFAFFFLLLVFLPIMGYIPELGSSDASYTVLIILMVLLGLTDSLVQSAVYGYASMLGSIFIQGVQVGNGLSGVLSSLLRILTKLFLLDDASGVVISSLIYFLISALIMAGCIVTFVLTQRSQFVKDHMRKISGYSETPDVTKVPHESTNFENVPLEDPVEPAVNFDFSRDEGEWRKEAYEKVSLKSIMRKMWLPAVIIALNFFITLSLFPGISGEMKSINQDFNDSAWFVITLFLVFNVGDLIGKFLPKWKYFQTVSSKKIYIMNAVRVIFFPLFILCVKPKVFDFDLFPFLFMALFALSNGYSGSYLMMYGPSKCDTHEKETASTTMAFFLVGGLALGSVCGSLLKLAVI
jgi:equilibrative nucleoside transporter 1/2/3